MILVELSVPVYIPKTFKKHSKNASTSKLLLLGMLFNHIIGMTEEIDEIDEIDEKLKQL